MNGNFGKAPRLEIRSVEKSYEDLKVIPKFSASVIRGEKNRADGPQRRRQNHHAEVTGAQRPGIIEDKGPCSLPIDGGEVRWGPRSHAWAYFAQDHGRIHHQGYDRD